MDDGEEGGREGGREARVLPFRASESNVESAMSPGDTILISEQNQTSRSCFREEEDKV